MPPFDPNRYGNPVARRKTGKDESNGLGITANTSAGCAATKNPPNTFELQQATCSDSYVIGNTEQHDLHSMRPDQDFTVTTTAADRCKPSDQTVLHVEHNKNEVLALSQPIAMVHHDTSDGTFDKGSKAQKSSLNPGAEPFLKATSASPFVSDSKNLEESSEIRTEPPLQPETAHKMLAKARMEKLKHIALKKRSRDQDATTSIGDLALARRSLVEHQNFVQMQEEYSETLETKTTTPTANVSQPPRLRDSRWATAIEMKQSTPASELCWVTNAKHLSSDASIASGDSMLPLHGGEPLVGDRQKTAATPLVGYDGNWQPPPVDWDDRPRFDNTGAAVEEAFQAWLTNLVVHDPTGKKVKIVHKSKISDLSWHPDRIGMVARDVTISKANARYYGYKDVTDVTKYAAAVDPGDFEDWGKLDLDQPDNKLHKDECAYDLARKWRQNVASRRGIQKRRAEAKHASKALKQIYQSEVVIVRPEINVYVRPAVKTDIWQLTEIYNDYINNGCRPTEISPISQEEMRERLVDAQLSKLPFLVAVLRNKKSMIRSRAPNNQHHPNGQGSIDRMMEGVEQVVGWASAQDFTATDFVERISVELEIYVKRHLRQKGVGRCLMDQILESLDCGYVKIGGHLFTCAPEARNVYSSGGHRDVHKILILLRKYKHPITTASSTPAQNGQLGAVDHCADQEDDFDEWLKAWLQRCGFNLEGILSGVGAKKGRYVDIAYMSRETAWQPKEGNIPEPYSSI